MKNKLLPFAITICILIGCNNKTEKSNLTTTDTIAVPKVIDSLITKKSDINEGNDAKISKTLLATYKSASSAELWEGLVFIDESGKEIVFINKNTLDKTIKEFWNSKITGGDPDDVTIEYHTQLKNVGNKYKINYIKKYMKYPTLDEGGGYFKELENVIVNFQLIQ